MSRISPIILNILYSLIFILISPLSLVKKRYKQLLFNNFSKRLFPKNSQPLKNNTIMIHASSVGEAKIAQYLVKMLKEYYNNKYSYLLTTMTNEGNALLKQNFPKENVKFLPFDFSFSTKSFLKCYKPKCIIFVEREIWPNLYLSAFKLNIPIIIVNARMSNRSFNFYNKFKFMKNIISKVKLILAQNNEAVKKFLDLGVLKDSIYVTNNLKYALSGRHNVIDEELIENLNSKLNLKKDNKCVLIGGSTHRPEEEYLIKILNELDRKRVRLILAPRHVERINEISDLLLKYNFKPVMYSNLMSSTEILTENSVIVINVMGALAELYQVADIAYIGGTLNQRGGQNMLEAARFGVPVIFGKNYENFREIGDKLLNNNAAVTVDDYNDLLLNVKLLINDKNKQNKMSENAKITSDMLSEDNKTLELLTKSIDNLIKEN